MPVEQQLPSRRSRRARVAALLTALSVVTGCSGAADRRASDGPSTSAQTTPTGPAATRQPSTVPAVVEATGVNRRDWSRLDSTISATTGTVAVLAAVGTPSGQIQVVHRTGPRGVLPIASVVKLYVMIALLDAIKEGRLEWERPLRVRPEDISAGSGSLAASGPGALVTVQEAARAMFQQSDNTATSALIRTLGQPALRRALDESAHSRKDLLTPFLTIREDLWLLSSSSPAAAAARAAWPRASARERERLIAPAASASTDFGVSPAWRSGLGYLASTEDVARAWARIRTLIADVGVQPASSIMSVRSPGFTAPANWRTVWFKSGALDGVRNGTWYAPGPAGDRVVVVLTSDASPAAGGVAGLGSEAAARLETYATGPSSSPR